MSSDTLDVIGRLATELGFQVEIQEDAERALAMLAYSAWWRDDREEIRARVGFVGPVSDVAEGPRADALRWLAGQGPPVERLKRARPRWVERVRR